MARNGSGTMTIPNSFVSGGTITASSHNQNYSDIATEITNSVAADGQTSMTGPLKASNGSAAAPSVSFASDTDSGIYRKAANSLAISLDGADRVVFSTASATFSCGASFQGAVGITGEFIASATATFVLTANFSSKPSVPAKSFPISKIADGTANRLYGTDGLGVATEITAGTGITISSSSIAASVVLPRGYIDGCTISNNGSDAVNDIDITAGACRDSTNAANITCAAMTGKQLDANWAPGSSAGIRNSGAGIANTTYHIYAVAKADGTQDYYAHTSTTVATVITALQAETGGASYVYARRIGSIVRSGATILAFTQTGNEFDWATVTTDVNNTADHTTAATATLTVPIGVIVQAKIKVGIIDNGAGGGGDADRGLLVTPIIVTNVAPPTSGLTSPGFSVKGLNSSTATWAELPPILTNTSGQIRYRANNAGVDTMILTRGWVDTRGRDS